MKTEDDEGTGSFTEMPEGTYLVLPVVSLHQSILKRLSAI